MRAVREPSATTAMAPIDLRQPARSGRSTRARERTIAPGSEERGAPDRVRAVASGWGREATRLLAPLRRGRGNRKVSGRARSRSMSHRRLGLPVVILAAIFASAAATSPAGAATTTATPSPGLASLDLAFRFATAIQSDPKDQAKAQEAVIRDLLLVGE